MNNSDRSLEHFFKTQYRSVYRFLMKKLGCPADAEDAAQETFLRLARQDMTAMRSPRAYLYTVARNLAADKLRSRRIRSVSVSSSTIEDYPSAVPTPDTAVDAMERRELVYEALAALPKRSREAFILHRFDGLSYKEVAQQMKISPKTVEKHIAKAMFQLRTTLSRLDR